MSFVSSSRASILDLLKFVVFAIILWTLSLTVLFPIIFLLQKWTFLRAKHFAMVWSRFGKNEKKLYFLKKMFFDKLKRDVPEFMDRQVTILEIGVGLTSNLTFYEENHTVTFACSNRELEKSLRKKSRNQTKISLVCALSDIENMPDCSFDFVISNSCLCCVPNVDTVLLQVRRVLKKDGKFAFFEHVGFPEDRIEFILQKVITKFWKILADGCCLDRHIIENLKRARFSTITYSTCYPRTQLLFMRPTIMGFCTK